MSSYKRLFLQGHSYYLTIVTHERNPILIQNIDLLRQSFRHSKSKYDYSIEAIVVMPDHFHLILTPKNVSDYPQIIRTIKQYFSKHCDAKYYEHIEQSKSREKEGYSPIWQKKYYEHTIRDEKDFYEKLNYIYNNPIKHGYVEEVGDWKYSSYHYR
jgi:putative transposase